MLFDAAAEDSIIVTAFIAQVMVRVLPRGHNIVPGASPKELESLCTGAHESMTCIPDCLQVLLYRLRSLITTLYLDV